MKSKEKIVSDGYKHLETSSFFLCLPCLTPKETLDCKRNDIIRQFRDGFVPLFLHGIHWIFVCVGREIYFHKNGKKERGGLVVVVAKKIHFMMDCHARS